MVREGYVAAAAARLFFREVGAGPPIVVLHGGPDFDHHDLLPELDRLASAFRTIYYDQRDRGRSADGVAPKATRLAKMRKIAATPAFAAGDIATEAEYHRLHYGPMLRRKELLDALLRRLRAIEERLHAQTWLAPDYDLPARLRAVDIPTLVVHGEYDVVPRACARSIAAAARRSRLVVLADCGHFPYLERPHDVEAAIVGFMRSGDAASSSAA